MKKRDNIEENVQSFFELAQKSFSELVIYYDLGDSYAKTRMENHDLLSTVFKINTHNINEVMLDQKYKFEDSTNIVDRPLCDEEGRIIEKIKFGEKGMFYLSIQDGYCLKNIETHSINSFFINYNKELNQYCFFKFSNEDHLIVSADYYKVQKGEKSEDYLPVYDKETEEYCWGAFYLASIGIEYDKIDDPKYEKELNEKLEHISSLMKHGYKEPESLPLIKSFAQYGRSHLFNLISSLDNLQQSIYENFTEFIGPVIESTIQRILKIHSEKSLDKIDGPSSKIFEQKTASERKKESPHSKFNNHLILIPKYKTGNKCQNRFQWYDENGDLKEGRLTDAPFDLIYYVAWLDQSNKKNLYFPNNVMDEHIVEIMGEKHSLGPKARFTSVWAQRDKTGRLKGQRMSDINKKIGKAIISRPETLLIINKNIMVDLQPFPSDLDKI